MKLNYTWIYHHTWDLYSTAMTQGKFDSVYAGILDPAVCGRLRLKCDGIRTETRFRRSAKRTSQFKSAGATVQFTTRSQCVRISGSNAAYTMFRGSVKSTDYPLHSPVSPSLLLPCVTVCHHVSNPIYAPITCASVLCSLSDIVSQI